MVLPPWAKLVLDELSKGTPAFAFSVSILVGIPYMLFGHAIGSAWHYVLVWALIFAFAALLRWAQVEIGKLRTEAEKAKSLLKSLRLLGEDDKRQLRTLMASGERTVQMHAGDPVGNHLRQAGIYKPDSGNHRGNTTGFSLTDSAWEAFTKDPKLLDPRSP